MRNLAKFLENPFDDPAIKWARLLAFSTDNLQRMIANNESGELAARITATTNALTLVGEMASDDETKLGLRIARKKAKKSFRDALPARIAKVSAAVVAKFGPESEQWLECFPHRRSIFSTCTDDALKDHLAQLKTAMTEYAADLGAPVLAEVDAMVTGWNTVWTGSEESTANKEASADDRRLARENLQLMLFLNLVKLMEMFPRQPEKLPLYMQQSLLEAPASGDEEEEEPPAPVPTP